MSENELVIEKRDPTITLKFKRTISPADYESITQEAQYSSGTKQFDSEEEEREFIRDKAAMVVGEVHHQLERITGRTLLWTTKKR